MQLGVTSKPYSFENQTWLYSHAGTESPKPATLDLALFTKNTHFPKGYLPSGLEIARVTATGKFGPYDPAANDGRQLEIQYLFTSIPLRLETGEAIGAVLDGTGTPTIVKSRLPITTKLTSSTEGTIGRRFIFEA